jgi:hypothetical protein
VIRRALLLASVSLAMSGCSPRYAALTSPPPFTVGELCDADDCGGEQIRLTQGMALAFDCVNYNYEPCTNVHARVEDPSVAIVFDGYLDNLSSPDFSYDGLAGAQPEGAVVVVGKQVGQTTLTVSSDDGETTFDVTIVPL